MVQKSRPFTWNDLGELSAWAEWDKIRVYSEVQMVFEGSITQALKAPLGGDHEGYFLMLAYLRWCFLTDIGLTQRDLSTEILERVRQASPSSFAVPRGYRKLDLTRTPELREAIPKEGGRNSKSL